MEKLWPLSVEQVRSLKIRQQTNTKEAKKEKWKTNKGGRQGEEKGRDLRRKRDVWGDGPSSKLHIASGKSNI